jgi:hypothetical protein
MPTPREEEESRRKPRRRNDGPAERRTAPCASKPASAGRLSRTREQQDDRRPLRTADPRSRTLHSDAAREDPAAVRLDPNKPISSSSRKRLFRLPNGSALSCRRPCPTLPPFGRRRRVPPRTRRRPATAPHAPDAGGQLQRLVRQPAAPREKTARFARRLDLELGTPEARTYRPACTEAIRTGEPHSPTTDRTLREPPTRAAGAPAHRRAPRRPGRGRPGSRRRSDAMLATKVPGHGTTLLALHTKRDRAHAPAARRAGARPCAMPRALDDRPRRTKPRRLQPPYTRGPRRRPPHGERPRRPGGEEPLPQPAELFS